MYFALTAAALSCTVSARVTKTSTVHGDLAAIKSDLRDFEKLLAVHDPNLERIEDTTSCFKHGPTPLAADDAGAFKTATCAYRGACDKARYFGDPNYWLATRPFGKKTRIFIIVQGKSGSHDKGYVEEADDGYNWGWSDACPDNPAKKGSCPDNMAYPKYGGRVAVKSPQEVQITMGHDNWCYECGNDPTDKWFAQTATVFGCEADVAFDEKVAKLDGAQWVFESDSPFQKMIKDDPTNVDRIEGYEYPSILAAQVMEAAGCTKFTVADASPLCPAR